MSCGDSEKRVTDVLGQPSHRGMLGALPGLGVDKGRDQIVLIYDAVSVDIDATTGRVTGMGVDTTSDLFKVPPSVSDPKLHYLGDFCSTVIRDFGEPDFGGRELPLYHDDKSKLRVRFFCPSGICRMISVTCPTD